MLPDQWAQAHPDHIHASRDEELRADNVREAHERNDDVLERIYIGRCFKNDTERLEKLFELYTQMTARQAAPKKPAGRKKKVSSSQKTLAPAGQAGRGPLR